MKFILKYNKNEIRIHHFRFKFFLLLYYLLSISILSIPANAQSPEKIINYDLAVKECIIKYLPDSGLYTFTITINNAGTKDAADFKLFLYNDKDLDNSISAADEQLWMEVMQDTIKSKNSINKVISLNNKEAGYKRLIFFIDFPADTKQSDNFYSINIFIPYPAKTIIINEIMADPITNQPEYIEFHNNSSYKINLYNWIIADQYLSSGSRNELKINNNLFIKPHEYLTISADTNLRRSFSYLSDSSYNFFSLNRSSLNLNNDQDDIVLLDFNKNAMDSVRYSSGWHNPNNINTKGISLERINFSINSNEKNNWGSCADKSGGTPCRKNSIMYEPSVETSSGSVIVEPNPFSPDMDGIEDYSIIKYTLNINFAKIRIRIYDSRGRIIRTLINNEYTSKTGEVIWDGFDDEKHKVRMGIYIILLEALDDSNGIVEVKKIPVVVAAKL